MSASNQSRIRTPLSGSHFTVSIATLELLSQATYCAFCVFIRKAHLVLMVVQFYDFCAFSLLIVRMKQTCTSACLMCERACKRACVRACVTNMGAAFLQLCYFYYNFLYKFKSVSSRRLAVNIINIIDKIIDKIKVGCFKFFIKPRNLHCQWRCL